MAVTARLPGWEIDCCRGPIEVGDDIWIRLTLYLGPGFTFGGTKDVAGSRRWLLQRRTRLGGETGLTVSAGGIYVDLPAIDSDWPSPTLAAEHQRRRDALMHRIPPGGRSVGLVGAVWASSHAPEPAGVIPTARFRVTRLRLVDTLLGPVGQEMPSSVTHVRERERVERFVADRVESDFLGRRWRHAGVLIDVCPAS